MLHQGQLEQFRAPQREQTRRLVDNSDLLPMPTRPYKEDVDKDSSEIGGRSRVFLHANVNVGSCKAFAVCACVHDACVRYRGNITTGTELRHGIHLFS